MSTRRPLLTDVVRDELRQTILTGDYSAGEKLPSGQELAAQLGISRITLREAVRGLVDEGYLLRRHGAGTYVTEKPRLVNNLDANFGVTEMIRRLGRTPGNRDVSVDEVAPSARVARLLELEQDERTLRIERVRTADGEPIVYSVEFIPLWVLGDRADDVRQLSGSLYAILAELGHPVSRGVARLSPVVATPELAQRLEIKRGEPLLFASQVDHAGAERPVLHSREWYRAAEMELLVYRRGPA